MRDRRIPVAALADGELELVLGRGGAGGGKNQRCRGQCDSQLVHADHYGLLKACCTTIACSPEPFVPVDAVTQIHIVALMCICSVYFFSVPRSIVAVVTAE